jgi:hypothetical protein
VVGIEGSSATRDKSRIGGECRIFCVKKIATGDGTVWQWFASGVVEQFFTDCD